MRGPLYLLPARGTASPTSPPSVPHLTPRLIVGLLLPPGAVTHLVIIAGWAYQRFGHNDLTSAGAAAPASGGHSPGSRKVAAGPMPGGYCRPRGTRGPSDPGSVVRGQASPGRHWLLRPGDTCGSLGPLLPGECPPGEGGVRGRQVAGEPSNSRESGFSGGGRARKAGGPSRAWEFVV